MASFVSPFSTSVFSTYGHQPFHKYLIVNFFYIDSQKGLIVDQKGCQREIDLSQLNIDWNLITVPFNLGRHCVSYIEEFYPGKEVEFITARTVSTHEISIELLEDNSKLEPSYFLFFGLN